MAVVISSEVVANEADLALPLSHPRILWDSIFRRGTVTESGEESAEFVSENATLDPATWNYWRADAMPAWLAVELDASEECDCALIAAHSLGTDGASIKVQYHDGSDWVDLTDEVAPGTDRVLMWLFDATAATRFRFYLTGSTVPSIGVAMIGKALAVQRKLYRGHTPITFARRTAIQPNLSEGGQYLGRSILRSGVGTNIDFANITAAWMRSDFEPFIASARSYPFGWAWRPSSYPAEVAYCWTGSDINPVNSGPRDLMSVSLSVEGMLD